MREISNRIFNLILVSVLIVYFLACLSFLLVDRANNASFILGGYGAGIDNQRVFIDSTGHAYAGQWNNRISSSSKIMGWSVVGDTLDLGFEFVLTILQIVVGASLLQGFVLNFLPIVLPFTIPFLALGLYKRLSAERFNRSYGAIIFAYSCLGSSAALQADNAGILGIVNVAYIILIAGLTTKFSDNWQSDIIVVLLAATVLPLVYHTLSSYALILLSIMIILELLVSRSNVFKSYQDINLQETLLAEGMIVFVSAFTIFIGTITDFLPFANPLSFSSFALHFSQFYGFSGVSAANIFSRISSYIDEVSVVMAALIFLIAILVGIRTILHQGKSLERVLFYITISLSVLSAGLLAAFGFFTGEARAYEAIWPLLPLLMVILFVRCPKNIVRVLALCALIGALITPCYFLFAQYQYGTTLSTYSTISYAGVEVPTQSSIFTDFSTAGSLTYFGHLKLFGLSVNFPPSKFSMVADTIYAKDTRASIDATLSNLTGTSSTVLLFTTQDLHSVDLERTTYNPDSSFIDSYTSSFDLVYSSPGGLIFVS
jgi:hypothetical protein